MNQEPKTNRRGICLVIVGPSGCGKTTIMEHLLSQDSNLVKSISVTTRERRQGEMDGHHYFFKTKDAFLKMIENNEMIEYSLIFDNLYGVPSGPIVKSLEKGFDVAMILDMQGFLKIKNLMKDDVVGVFVLPPSYEELAKRINKRNNGGDDIEKRLQDASMMISEMHLVDYAIVNNDVNESVVGISNILNGERFKMHRNIESLQSVLADFSIQSNIIGFK